MNQLQINELNSLLLKRAENFDERKPVRKLVDNVIAPAAGVAIGVGAGAVKALNNLDYKEKPKVVA